MEILKYLNILGTVFSMMIIICSIIILLVLIIQEIINRMK